MFTFTHPEKEEEVGRAAEEEKCSNDDNEEEAEERQHDEKHEDVKKEVVEEERKCHARFVYLGHLTSRRPRAISPSLPVFLYSPISHIVHPLAIAAFSSLLLLAWKLMAPHESLNTLNGSII